MEPRSFLMMAMLTTGLSRHVLQLQQMIAELLPIAIHFDAKNSLFWGAHQLHAS